MAYDGYSDSVHGYNTVIIGGAQAKADHVKAVVSPIGSITFWLKTYGTADSGTTTSTSAGKLVETGQNFISTVVVGMIVRNTTDSTYTYVTAIDSNTTLSLADDIMGSGETYVIYKTPYLPDAWVECNGQVLSDAESPYNGETIPDLNTTPRFLRGALFSGSTGGADTHTLTTDEIPAHDHNIYTGTQSASAGHVGGNPPAGEANSVPNTLDGVSIQNTGGGQAHNNIPAYYAGVWIMRVK